MIEIYNTLIDESGIIGVGPLLMKTSADPVLAQVYVERTYLFEVYTTHFPFTISTDPLSFTGEFADGSKQHATDIAKAHRKLRQCLLDDNFIELR